MKNLRWIDFALALSVAAIILSAFLIVVSWKPIHRPAYINMDYLDPSLTIQDSEGQWHLWPPQYERGE